MRFTADCHVHSNTSPDATDEIAAYCQAAVEKGLSRICFTNHYEVFPGDPTPADFLFSYDAYRDEVERARDRFGDRLEILMGVEFGAPHRHPREFDRIREKDFDMIIASVHFLPMDFGIHWFWSPRATVRKEVEDYFFQCYYREMADIAAYGGFHVLAHFDWPKRIGFPFRVEEDACRGIFSALLKNGAMLEVNTSAYGLDFESAYPSPDLLDLYWQAGGRRLTVGSDAHRAERVAADFDRAARDLDAKWEIGFFRGGKFIANGGEAAGVGGGRIAHCNP